MGPFTCETGVWKLLVAPLPGTLYCCLLCGRAEQASCAASVGAACSSVLLGVLAPALERSESSHLPAHCSLPAFLRAEWHIFWCAEPPWLHLGHLAWAAGFDLVPQTNPFKLCLGTEDMQHLLRCFSRADLFV